MNKKILVFVALSLTVYGSEPLAASWTPASPMHQPRAFFAAAELPNGNILVAGGFDLGVTFADSKIYNWHTGLWTVTASMNNAPSAPVAVQLENGRVRAVRSSTILAEHAREITRQVQRVLAVESEQMAVV